MIYPLESELEPVLDGVAYDAIAKDKEWQEIEYHRCATEPWYWLVNYVWTVQKDETVEGSEVNRFPADEYLRYTFDIMFRERYLCIDKSRQMRMTWLLMAYALYLAQFNEKSEVICQTKKENVADTELVKRAYFMATNQPSWLRPKFAKTASSFCLLKFPNGSLIRGIPKGGDQIRSFNPTTTIIDEAGFLEGEFDECRTAALACCKDIKLVSTANGGQWGVFINGN